MNEKNIEFPDKTIHKIIPQKFYYINNLNRYYLIYYDITAEKYSEVILERIDEGYVIDNNYIDEITNIDQNNLRLISVDLIPEIIRSKDINKDKLSNHQLIIYFDEQNNCYYLKKEYMELLGIQGRNTKVFKRKLYYIISEEDVFKINELIYKKGLDINIEYLSSELLEDNSIIIQDDKEISDVSEFKKNIIKFNVYKDADNDRYFVKEEITNKFNLLVDTNRKKIFTKNGILISISIDEINKIINVSKNDINQYIPNYILIKKQQTKTIDVYVDSITNDFYVMKSICMILGLEIKKVKNIDGIDYNLVTFEDVNKIEKDSKEKELCFKMNYILFDDVKNNRRN